MHVTRKYYDERTFSTFSFLFFKQKPSLDAHFIHMIRHAQMKYAIMAGPVSVRPHQHDWLTEHKSSNRKKKTLNPNCLRNKYLARSVEWRIVSRK